MNLLEAVTRILRQNAILRGDTDAPASFSDTNHNASMQLAIMAIQDEVAYLVADKLIPYEKTSDTITLSPSTRTYSLDSTFVNFYGFRTSTTQRITVSSLNTQAVKNNSR